MSHLVDYSVSDGVAAIAMDDGKVNALSLSMLKELDGAFDRAQADNAVVVFSGRPGLFSAGFDLGVLRAGGRDTADMLQAGFELAERMLSFPTPVVVACPGHAIAMGAFLVLSGDYRIGVTGPFRLTANEVAIGLTMPYAAVEICRQRLAPAHFNRAVVLADVYSPEESVAAGFLDRVVPPDQLDEIANVAAQRARQLDLNAHHATKLRARAGLLRALREAIEQDNTDLATLMSM